MKRPYFAILFVIILTSIRPVVAQAPKPNDAQEQQVVALVKEVQAQQLQIAANQTKIDAKLAEVTEAIRIARIYASRTK